MSDIDLQKQIDLIDQEIQKEADALGKLRKTNCFPFLLGKTDIGHFLVDAVYDDLIARKFNGESLDVILDSGGGDIHAAYSIGLLFRRFATANLTFIVPRWAKSAATLLACAGDTILMGPVAELGPLDPQITAMNPLEQRVESFSPLDIESTLQLIRDEFENGNGKLADGLLQRLQFPLTLGSYKKKLDVGSKYVEHLLASRMLKGKGPEARKIGKGLTTRYADHGWCISVEEAKQLGLLARELKENELNIVWKVHNLNKRKQKLIQQGENEKVMEQLKELDPELLRSTEADDVPPNDANDDSETKESEGAKG